MNVIFVAQCTKNALANTRRVLDQFAERKGHRTWQTQITMAGLVTLRKLLTQKARKNTAVSCHWLRSRNSSELVWIVGNAAQFNEQGSVPTNTSAKDILRRKDEDTWHHAQLITHAACIAGLFHDFGKANKLFQAKIKPNAQKSYEPLRHEWLSYQFFLAFIHDCDDKAWLEKLAQVSKTTEAALWQTIKSAPKKPDNPHCLFQPQEQSPFGALVAWLILTHHRLPVSAYNSNVRNTLSSAGSLKKLARQKTNYNTFNPSWNSPQVSNVEWKAEDFENVWTCTLGTPFKSTTWQAKAQAVARKAQRDIQFTTLAADTVGLNNRFTAHLARLVLMLADHCYSDNPVTPKWQDTKYKAYANSDQDTGALHQKLDEHNIGVSHFAYLFARQLPKVRDAMPALPPLRLLKRRDKNPDYNWQNKAFDTTRHIAHSTFEQGFFGINMASTGQGKTFANARIMYALDDNRNTCRFNVALGLRTLTMQTARAFQERLKLPEETIALLVGSKALKDLEALHVAKAKAQSNKASNNEDKNQTTSLSEQLNASIDNKHGSESLDDCFGDGEYPIYDGRLDETFFGRWLNQSRNAKSGLHKLVSAPVLVSTIDYLMPATEASRGNNQIAAMLRLLTSDLVIDEPDDFGLSDLPALSRLVHMAGVMGSRVLLSSATLPPSIVQALFQAYAAGRKIYNQSCKNENIQSVQCAWFDEFGASSSACAYDQTSNSSAEFTAAHMGFITQRIKKLQASTVIRRRACLISFDDSIVSADEVAPLLAPILQQAMLSLHQEHHVVQPVTNIKASFGLVRFANINPMLQVVRELIAMDMPDEYCLHFCVYHSRYPLLLRSEIEHNLDTVLKRNEPQAIWSHETVAAKIQQNPHKQHLFVVFGTAVTEVGRDHDYDWAIVEPSSIRSIVQLAGRLLRHRDLSVTAENMLILSKNINALQGKALCFEKPGFEDTDQVLISHDLQTVLEPSQYTTPDAIVRLQPRAASEPSHNLVDLEHAQMRAMLFDRPNDKPSASLWWQQPLHWCFELQRNQMFRQSTPQTMYGLFLEEDFDTDLVFKAQGVTKAHPWVEQNNKFTCLANTDINLGCGVSVWIDTQPMSLITRIAQELDIPLTTTAARYMQFSLDANEDDWTYHPWLGIFKPPKK